jgi:RNA polymerase sigma-70 factor (ECF subfamily)
VVGRTGGVSAPEAGGADRAGRAWTTGPDAGLVVRLKRGDAGAFEEVLKKYETKVYNLARGLTHNDQDAQDALQDAFLGVFKNIAKFKEDCSLSTWIYRIAVNSALMKIRKRRQDDRTVSIDEAMPQYDDTGHRVASLPDWHPRADQLLLNKELGEYLRESIAALEPEYRTVLVMRDVEGLDNEEVARVVNLSVAAVKSRLHRARIFIRERVKRYVLEGR